jgi:hypothetical protein
VHLPIVLGMTDNNYLRKVAIVGVSHMPRRSLRKQWCADSNQASGHSGRYMTEAILAAGKHTVTAITRQDSKSMFLEGVEVRKVDYGSQESIVSALRGQDALIITLSGTAPVVDLQKKLIDAAVEAGVRWVLPNDWGFDTTNPALIKDIFISNFGVQVREYAKQKSNISFTSVITGFWYEWSLAIGPAYGVDIEDRSATLFDDGNAKITTSTWPQVGRAVASLLALPITSEQSGRPCLNDYKDQPVFIGSFFVSQRDMLESLYRVTETKESDWKITTQPARDRYYEGLEQMKTERIGFAKMMYSRIFWDDNVGDCEDKLINKQLGLPKEDLDEATARAVQRAKAMAGKHWFEHAD